MSAESTSYIHGTDAREQDRLALMNRAINSPALRQMALAGGERILDVGSGLGIFTREMARVAGSRGFVVGVERDQDQRATAARLAGEAGETDLVDLREGDALNLSLPDDEWNSFDIVHCRFLLEHLADPLLAVKQMVRAARPGGRVVIQDDDHDLMRFWPELPGFEGLWRAYMDSYRRLGFDPRIGRRLTGLLVDAGSAPRLTTWLYYGTCQGHELFPTLHENIILVLDGARTQIVEGGTISDEEVSRTLEEVAAWGDEPDAAIWYAINWAEGIKPAG